MPFPKKNTPSQSKKYSVKKREIDYEIMIKGKGFSFLIEKLCKTLSLKPNRKVRLLETPFIPTLQGDEQRKATKRAIYEQFCSHF